MLGRGLACSLVVVTGLSGCGVQDPQPTGIHDPYEGMNRDVHAFNKGFDELVFKAPPGQPRSIRNQFVQSVSNAGSNLGLPSKVLNSILQGRPAPAVQNTFRFVINSTIGIAGLFDPAGNALGLTEQDTDFGETLAVWGVHEGPYIELPFFGPSTGRDAVGRVVDYVTDPVGAVAHGAGATADTGTQLAGKAADRKINGDVIESILYDSADSYAQERLLYLQNRRFHLAGKENNDANSWDPYSDPAPAH